MPELTEISYSETPLGVQSSQGKLFTYDNNLYNLYCEGNNIKIKNQNNINIVYNGSYTFQIYDSYIDNNILWICGTYGYDGFYLSYSLSSNSILSFVTINYIRYISHIFIIQNRLHYIYITNTSIILVSVADSESSISTVIYTNWGNKNPFISGYKYYKGTLSFFIQEEQDTNESNYLCLKVLYQDIYLATESFVPEIITLSKNTANIIFSGIYTINKVDYLITIEEDYIQSFDSVQNNIIRLYTFDNLRTSQTNFSFSLNDISIYKLSHIYYLSKNYLIGFCYQSDYENIKYLWIELNDQLQPINQLIITSNVGYLSINGLVNSIVYNKHLFLNVQTTSSFINLNTREVMETNYWYIGYITDYIINPINNCSWIFAGTTHLQRKNSLSCLLPNNNVILIGGEFEMSTLNSCEIYNLKTGYWIDTSNLLESRTSFTADLLNDGRVLVTGGESYTNRTSFDGSIDYTISSCELFNYLTNTWASAPSLNLKRRYHTSTLLHSGKVLVIGGKTSSQTNSSTNSCEIFDPVTNSWSVVAPLNVPRAYHTSTLLNSGLVLVVGGINNTNGLSTCEIYNPIKNTWNIVQSYPIIIYEHTSTLLNSGKVLVAGGSHDGVLTNKCYLFDPIDNTWSQTISLTKPRKGHSSILLNSGKVVILGGNENTMEFYYI